jgi:hypothetical protein
MDAKASIPLGWIHIFLNPRNPKPFIPWKRILLNSQLLEAGFYFNKKVVITKFVNTIYLLGY